MLAAALPFDAGFLDGIGALPVNGEKQNTGKRRF
jgi:hypothetical protein